MEATDLAVQLGLCVYFDRVLYRSDVFIVIAVQQTIKSTIN